MSGRACHALVVILAATATLQSAVRAAPDQAFRSGPDLIPVDVQVIDGDGRPAEGLTAGQFEVAIDGAPRRVVSVDFVDHRDVAAQTSDSVLVLAIDSASLEAADARRMAETVAEFMRRVPASTRVGLLAYPSGPRLEPTLDHQAVVTALAEVGGRRTAPPPGQFALTSSELVELSTLLPGVSHTAEAERLLEALCPDDIDGACEVRLTGEVLGQVLLGESHLQSDVGTMAALMRDLANVPARKTLVFISGGITTADIPFARPDARGAGVTLGRLAAAANVNVYTVFVSPPPAAARPGRRPDRSDPLRNARISSLWLQQLSGAAGGSMLDSADGAGAFDRILAETSTYYLLGVEPSADDRGGRFHELEVTVLGRGTDVRGRSWVLLPAADTAPADASVSASAAPRAVAPAVQAFADAFDRDDAAGLARLLAAPGAANAVRALRDGSWGEVPRREAAFALDVALAGLRATSTFTQQAALQLLVDSVVRVGRSGIDAPFACLWFDAAGAGLAGLSNLPAAPILVEYAVGRCPTDARLHLTLAVVQDQQLPRSMLSERPATGAQEARLPEAAEQVLNLYEAAAGFPATRDEARVRAAWLLLRHGHLRQGLDQLATVPGPPDDPVLRYYAGLVAGELFRALDQPALAQDALEAALDAWPAGQTARVALMTLLVARGDVEGAVTLAERVQTATPGTGDPWWAYRVGDYRVFPTLRARLLGALP